MHPLCGVLPVPCVPVRVIRRALIAHRSTYAPPRCRTSQYRRLLFLSQYLSGTIWLTPYSMVWDWRVLRAGPMPFCWPSCFLLFCLQLFSLSFLFLYTIYRLVVWGWGLRTDMVSISLSRSCIANLFLIIIIKVTPRNLTVETFVSIVSRILMSNGFFFSEIIIYEVLLTFRESLLVLSQLSTPTSSLFTEAWTLLMSLSDVTRGN